MSTTYSISRFSRPTKKDLKIITDFLEYNQFYLQDEEGRETGEYIKLFRKNNPYSANLCETRFAVPMELPETVTDYNRMFKDMGFSEEAIRDDRIHIRSYDGWYYEYYDEDEKVTKQIIRTESEKYDIRIQTECFAIKIKDLWDSSEVYAYPDREKVDKYIPELDRYTYVLVTNCVLAKAEIPFLIFERNKGRCFLDRS